MAEAPLLAIENLAVEYRTDEGVRRAIRDVSFTIAAGEAFGLVGESGSGKSTVALAIMRYLGRAGRVAAGRILVEGTDLAGMRGEPLRRLRGGRVAMVYQDPQSSLNPVMTIGRQLMEVALLHRTRDRAAARDLVLRTLAEVELPDPEAMMQRYPHQLSGGQQQRIVIAMALVAEPALLVLDEPTTGLDVTVEAAVLDLVDRLRRRRGTAILLISHNLGVVRRLCDRIGVLYAGSLVEEGSLDAVFRRPRHPYTRGLLGAVPSVGLGRHRPLVPIRGQLDAAALAAPGCVFAERCGHRVRGRCDVAPIPLTAAPDDPAHAARCVRADELAPFAWGGGGVAAPVETAAPAEPILVATGLGKRFSFGRGWLGRKRRTVRALEDVGVTVRQGRTLAIVGESGSGKSTLARVMIGLSGADTGEIALGDTEIARMPIGRRPRDVRRRLQMVFQNPDATLNPSHTVGYAIGRSLRRLRGFSRGQARDEVARLLERVQLPPEFAQRRPDQLSGGQRQRVAIARALAADPEIIIADEPVSALDVSVQAAVVNLLAEMQERTGVALVFISHDLALVRHMADEVALFYRGRVVEQGPAEAVFAPPFHPYTQALLAAAPDPDPDVPRHRAAITDQPLAAVAVTDEGCPFVARCPRRIEALCATVRPPIRELPGGHRIACHLAPADLPRALSDDADAAMATA
ncbi:MAG: dipeptide ABC transporter ATP-binding protein [Alphaproteobacteria bacterium]